MGYDVYIYNKIAGAPTPIEEERRVEKVWAQAPVNQNGERILDHDKALYNDYHDILAHGDSWSVLEYFEKENDIECGKEYPVSHETIRKFYSDIGYELSVPDQKNLRKLLRDDRQIWMLHSW